MTDLPKFSPTAVLCYTVLYLPAKTYCIYQYIWKLMFRCICYKIDFYLVFKQSIIYLYAGVFPSVHLHAYTSFTRARLLGFARISSDRFEKVPSSHELQKRDLAWKIKAPNIKYLL